MLPRLPLQVQGGGAAQRDPRLADPLVRDRVFLTFRQGGGAGVAGVNFGNGLGSKAVRLSSGESAATVLLNQGESVAAGIARLSRVPGEPVSQPSQPGGRAAAAWLPV